MLPRALFLCFGLLLAAPAMAQEADRGEQSLAAAEAAMNVGNDRQAETMLSRIPPASLGVAQMARAQIVRAEISLKRGQPMTALQSLPTGSDHVPLYAERIEGLRGTALFQLRDPVNAVRALVLRERYLQSDSAALSENRDQIWQGLMKSSPTREDMAHVGMQDNMTRGWLELAWISEQGPAARYEDWLSRYARHPAAARVAGLKASPRPVVAQAPATRAPPPAAAVPGAPRTPSPYPVPALSTTLGPPAVAAAPAPIAYSGGGRGYALLLPLTGPFAATGEAVRDGFMSAIDRNVAANVRVYDTGSAPSQALSAYQTAVAEGAGVVVGPLQRDAVAALAHQGSLPTPVVALNAVDGAPASGIFLQFGLAPEDEARAAADQAIGRDLHRAIVLVPRSEWGNRVAAAFTQRLREAGGTVLAADTFESGTPDPSKIISRLVSQDASEARHKALTGVLGKETEFDARRRGDLDFIFLAAKPSDSRVILPQLRFFRVGGLPIYSTSLIYEGHGIDWSNIRVCDMPWMTESKGSWADQRSQVALQYAGPMQDYPRLVALGADAYRLANRLQTGTLRSNEAMDGATGRLKVAADGRVSRDLTCSAPRIADAPAPPTP